MVAVWSEAEARAWYPPERLTPSQWTERHRVLPPSVAAEAGQLRLARTPYIYGIIDAITEPGVEEVVCLKSVQVAWSTLCESLVGYWIDNDPGPILYVLDSEKTAKEVMDERLGPLVQDTPAVKQHLSPHAHDNTLTGIKFDTCPLYMAWAGSPASLARRAVRYVICDEADKYKGSGKEGDPISLASERTATYGYRRKVLIGSTPTVRTGAIWRAWESSGDKRKYYVPCPHCGEFQPLVFGQIKYPPLAIQDKNIYADTIKTQNLAYYECVSCKTPIKDGSKPKMLAKGIWLSETQTIDKSGVVTGSRPKAQRVGFWINAIYSPWRSFSEIAAEHRKSIGDPGRMQNFKNSWLAEPFEEIVKTASVDDFRKLRDGAPAPGIVPAWAVYIVATADVQKDRMYWVVRAWGADYQSQLISYGIALSFSELHTSTLQAQFKLATGGTHPAMRLFIDCGYRTDEVYQFAQTDNRIQPVKGDNDTQQMPVKYSPAGKQWGLPLWMLNTQLLKDRLSVFRSDPNGRWKLHSDVDDEYLKQLASEEKKLIKGVERWETKSSGAANHYLDCEVYQIAAADMLQVNTLAVEPQQQELPPPVQGFQPSKGNASQEIKEIEYMRENEREKKSFLGDTKGWL